MLCNCIRSELNGNRVNQSQGNQQQPDKSMLPAKRGKVSYGADDFVTPQPPELQCLKCRRVPCTPKRSKCCNSLYCDECSETITFCPVHKQTVEHVTDSALKSRIAKYIIRCEHKCGWKGPTNKLKEHLPECTGNNPENPVAATFSIHESTKCMSMKVSSESAPKKSHSQVKQLTTAAAVRKPQQSSVSFEKLQVVRELQGVSSKWFTLGSKLNLDRGQLEHIGKVNYTNPNKCLEDVLERVMIGESSVPWKKICKALKSDVVDEKLLAKNLKMKYCSVYIQKEHKATEFTRSTNCGAAFNQSAQTFQVSDASDEPETLADKDFVNPLPPELHCVQCKQVPRKPRRSKCCNTLYCAPCSTRQEVCPAHKQKQEYRMDSDLRNKVYKLTLYCSKGCGWKGVWSKMKEHLKECGTSDPSIATSSMTVTKKVKTTTTTHTTKATFELPSQQRKTKSVSELRARSITPSQQPVIHFGGTPKMDLLHLIKYTGPDGREQSLKLVDKLGPYWMKMGFLLGIEQHQLDLWKQKYNSSSNCSGAVFSFFLNHGSHGTYQYPTTWGGVIKLMQDLDLQGIADEIKKIAC